jgi:hypothetical protein
LWIRRCCVNDTKPKRQPLNWNLALDTHLVLAAEL